MTDRELLELAAKAAGLDAHWGSGWQADTMFVAVKRPSDPVVADVEWNPRADSGDSLLLASTLRISITYIGRGAVQTWADSTTITTEVIHEGDDPDEATRRAVLQTAAELGKAMP